MQPRNIRVLVVDDHPLTYTGMRYFLSAFTDLDIVGEASNGHEAIDLCQRWLPDVVLMDMVMPGMDGIEATQIIKEQFPQIRVLALSSYADGQLVERALRVGASGYVIKTITAFDLAQAIRHTHEGRSVIAPEATEVLLIWLQQQAEQLRIDLTEREQKVLRLMVEGLSNAQIAAQLNISRATVKYYISGIFTKLGVSSRAEAIAIAYRQQLI